MIPPEKEGIRQKILQLNFDSGNKREMNEIAEYCMQDCRACAALFQHQCSIPENRNRLDRLMSWWPIYLLAVAKMELRSIPFDVLTYRKIVANQGEIRAKLASEINAVAPVMEPSGTNRYAFRKFCVINSIPLPRKYDKAEHKIKFSVENEALKEIEHHHPLIPKIRETNKTLTALRNNKMTMDFGRERHYFSVGPFGIITGRNASRQFIFGKVKWMRYLVVPESPEHVLVNVDYTAQEIGIAAAQSGDGGNVLGERPAHGFCRICGSRPERRKQGGFS